jgi:hypothetical protein
MQTIAGGHADGVTIDQWGNADATDKADQTSYRTSGGGRFGMRRCPDGRKHKAVSAGEPIGYEA